MALTLLLSVSTFGIAGQITEEEVHVDGPRPLMAAVAEFSRRCGCLVSYEDPKWTRDQAIASQNVRNNKTGQPLLTPSGSPFWFTVPKDLSQLSLSQVAERLGGALVSYEATSNRGAFKIVHGATGLHVLPTTPGLLERTISVKARENSAAVAVQDVIDELHRVSGETIGMWDEPVNLMSKQIRVGGHPQPAYEALASIMAEVDPRLSWQLPYDVNTKAYSLNIYRSIAGPRAYPK
jgi:hypothetical protein